MPAGPGAGLESLPPPPGSAVIGVYGVTKKFGDVVAVSDVSFTVGPGVTSLLGPNGAGKSTLFRMVCGLARPSRGVVEILGENARVDAGVRGRIGLVPQQDALFDRLDAHGFVEVAAVTHGVDRPRERADEALATVELDPRDPKPIGSYSKGMRQRVKLAAALVHDPEVIIADEPLNGLDPVQRRRMIGVFRSLGEAGKCVLVSSHVLDEVARIGSRVLVIAQGRLVATGDFHELRALMDDRPHRIRVDTQRPRALAAALIEASIADGVRVDGDAVECSTDDIDRFRRGLAPLSRDLDVSLSAVVPLDDDLESVFRYLVERR